MFGGCTTDSVTELKQAVASLFGFYKSLLLCGKSAYFIGVPNCRVITSLRLSNKRTIQQ